MAVIAQREALLAAVEARLRVRLAGMPVQRARRAPVLPGAEPLPRLLVLDDGDIADPAGNALAQEAETAVAVQGFAAAASDIRTEQALNSLHARTVAALAGWTPDTPGVLDLVELGAAFEIHAAADSAAPAGEFTARFSARVIQE